jgi:hypothetical protein
VFWIIYAYDREMIYPKLLDNFIPGWLNHGMVSEQKQMISFTHKNIYFLTIKKRKTAQKICTVLPEKIMIENSNN